MHTKHKRMHTHTHSKALHAYTVKMNALYLIKKNCGNRLQAILLIQFNTLELTNN